MDDLHGFTHLQCQFYHRNKSTNSGIYQHFPGIFRDLNRKHEVFTVGSVGGSLFLDKLENWGIQAKWILTNKTILVCIGISEKLGAAKSSKLLVMFNRKLMVKRHTSDYFPSILYLVGALEHLFFSHSVGNFISFQLTNKKMGSAQYGTTGPHWDGAPNGESWGCWFRTHRIHVYYIYMVTFTINIPQMLAYIPAPWIRHGEGKPTKLVGWWGEELHVFCRYWMLLVGYGWIMILATKDGQRRFESWLW